MFFKKKEPSAAEREPMRSLIQRLSLGPQGKNMRVIVFISARSREGTSTIATDYSRTLAAESNQRVLLIDAGRLMPKRFQVLDIDPSVGIVDTVVAGHLPKEAIHSVGEVSISRWVGRDENRPAIGKMMHNPDFWQSLLASFDSIIIDAPSLQNSFDGITLAAKADATVIVVEAEKTPAAVIRHLQGTLATAGAKVMGVVMNKRRFYIPERIYRRL